MGSKCLRFAAIAVIFAFLIVAFPLYSYAFDPAAAPPDWLAQVIAMISAMPYVGPVVVVALKWVGVLAGIMTGLSVFADLIFKTLITGAGMVGLQGTADKLAAFSAKLMPWLKYFSVFNVQKAPPAAAAK